MSSSDSFPLKPASEKIEVHFSTCMTPSQPSHAVPVGSLKRRLHGFQQDAARVLLELQALQDHAVDVETSSPCASVRIRARERRPYDTSWVETSLETRVLERAKESAEEKKVRVQ